MKRNILGAIWVMGVLSFAGFCLSSCTPELDVQQAYDFSLQTLPVQKDIIKGAVAEIRCSLKPEGDFNQNYCCPVKVFLMIKIRLKTSCRISASFVTLLVGKKLVT